MIELQNLSLSYGRQEVVGNLSLTIARGDFLGLVGPNGAGKTTILRTILGLMKIGRGKVMRERSIRFGYCSQRQSIDETFPFTVWEIVMMGRTSLLGPLIKPKQADREKVVDYLKIAGIEDLSERRFAELSGGQKQRTLIARALAAEPGCLILDEPTTDLDIKGSREIMDLLKDLHQNSRLTIILASHELDKILNYAHHFLFLSQEQKPTYVSREDLDGLLLSQIFGLDLKLNKVGDQMVIL